MKRKGVLEISFNGKHNLNNFANFTKPSFYLNHVMCASFNHDAKENSRLNLRAIISVPLDFN